MVGIRGDPALAFRENVGKVAVVLHAEDVVIVRRIAPFVDRLHAAIIADVGAVDVSKTVIRR